MPATTELVAHNKSIKQIGRYIGADELIYQSLEDLKRSATIGNPKIKHFEDSVFTGKYCTEGVTGAFLKKLERSRLDSSR
jgi:amidophosphoribosyltransferase